MAAEGGCIDFMFLAPPYPATGSATGLRIVTCTQTARTLETDITSGMDRNSSSSRTLRMPKSELGCAESPWKLPRFPNAAAAASLRSMGALLWLLDALLPPDEFLPLLLLVEEFPLRGKDGG